MTSPSATPASDPTGVSDGPEHHHIGSDPGNPQPKEELLASEPCDGPVPQGPRRSRSPCRPGGRPTTCVRGACTGSRRASSGRPDTTEDAHLEPIIPSPRRKRSGGGGRSFDAQGRRRERGGGSPRTDGLDSASRGGPSSYAE